MPADDLPFSALPPLAEPRGRGDAGAPWLVGAAFAVVLHAAIGLRVLVGDAPVAAPDAPEAAVMIDLPPELSLPPLESVDSIAAAAASADEVRADAPTEAAPAPPPPDAAEPVAAEPPDAAVPPEAAAEAASLVATEDPVEGSPDAPTEPVQDTPTEIPTETVTEAPVETAATESVPVEPVETAAVAPAPIEPVETATAEPVPTAPIEAPPSEIAEPVETLPPDEPVDPETAEVVDPAIPEAAEVAEVIDPVPPVLPPRKPSPERPTKTVEKKTPPKRRAVAPPAAPTRTARADTPAAASRPAIDSRRSAGAGKPDANAMARYLASVRADIMRQRRSVRVDGRGRVAVVRFTIEASGALAGVALATSSGSPALDEAALAIVRRASPVPAMPEGLGASLRTRLPVRFD